jgi:hypothetical protein
MDQRKEQHFTHQFLAKNKIAVIPHPPYSPDMAPCDFFWCLHVGGNYFDLRVTAADRPYGEFYDFYSISPENFGSTHVQLPRYSRTDCTMYTTKATKPTESDNLQYAQEIRHTHKILVKIFKVNRLLVRLAVT